MPAPNRPMHNHLHLNVLIHVVQVLQFVLAVHFLCNVTKCQVICEVPCIRSFNYGSTWLFNCIQFLEKNVKKLD